MSQVPEPARLRDIFVASTGIGAKESTLIHRSLRKLGVHDFEIVEHNRRGLPEVYNEFLDRFAGQDRILVLAHSDVLIFDAFLREKLTQASTLFNIIGLAGSSHFDPALQTPDFRWTIWPPEFLSGAVEHVAPDGSLLWCAYGPTPRRCVAMDGMFLAIDMLTIGDHRFDPQFTFHLYDIDFCLSAHMKNLVMGTTNICVQHASGGNYGTEAYRRSLERFQKKWAADTQKAKAPQTKPD
jgi:hypothetical protein